MFKTLRKKVVFLTTISVLFTSLIIVSTIYKKSFLEMKRETINVLAGETRLIALKFQSAYDHIRNDAYIAANSNAVSELINIMDMSSSEAAQKSNDIQLWKRRLEDNFISIMQRKPYYTQMRFIGFTNNGREIVRVNRREKGFERVKDADLQDKSSEFYYKEALELGYGEDYFSKITYNREHGKVEDIMLPTLRSVVPVFDQHGYKFGFVVINVDYRELLITQYKHIKPNSNIFIMNEYGDYMEYSPKLGLLDLILDGAKDNYTLQFLHTAEAVAHDEYYIETHENIIYTVKIMITPDEEDNYLRAVLVVPRGQALQNLDKIRESIYGLTALIILFVLVLSFFISALITRSLSKMSNDLTKAVNQNDYNLKDLPVKQQDEVGQIARAVDAMSNELQKRKAS